MDLTYSTSKNGSKIFTYNSINFHSTYSPEKEAERFVSLCNFDYEPSIIFIIEPGISYSYSYFKNKYPETKIGIIRIIEQLQDKNWDFVINFKDFTKNKLLNTFNPDVLLNSQIVCWPVAEKLFLGEITNIYKTYRDTLQQCKTLTITNQYFEKKWLINSCNFIKYLKNVTDIKFDTKNIPVIITASGPSLEYCLQELKELQNYAFIIALSSSISALLFNNIKPDLILSTDGGFWAGQHLKKLNKINCPVAVPTEAFVPKFLLESKKIIPLKYADGLSADFFDICKINYLLAERNGTVSGTALRIAETITNGPIFFCGLDLACSKGFQHTNPNELEVNNSIRDNKIKTLEKRSARSGFNNEALNIYRNWFEKAILKNKVFRIISSSSNLPLGYIKDISKEKMVEILKSEPKVNTKDLFSNPIIISERKKKENCKKFLAYIESNLKDEKFLKQLFPLDFISLLHCKNNSEKEHIINRINKNAEELMIKIRNILNG